MYNEIVCSGCKFSVPLSNHCQGWAVADIWRQLSPNWHAAMVVRYLKSWIERRCCEWTHHLPLGWGGGSYIIQKWTWRHILFAEWWCHGIWWYVERTLSEFNLSRLCANFSMPDCRAYFEQLVKKYPVFVELERYLPCSQTVFSQLDRMFRCILKDFLTLPISLMWCFSFSANNSSALGMGANHIKVCMVDLRCIFLWLFSFWFGSF